MMQNDGMMTEDDFMLVAGEELADGWRAAYSGKQHTNGLAFVVKLAGNQVDQVFGHGMPEQCVLVARTLRMFDEALRPANPGAQALIFKSLTTVVELAESATRALAPKHNVYAEDIAVAKRFIERLKQQEAPTLPAAKIPEYLS